MSEMQNRPDSKTGATEVLAGELNYPTLSPMQSRYAAAKRLPPLNDGRQDPLLEPRPSMTEIEARRLCNELAAQGCSDIS